MASALREIVIPHRAVAFLDPALTLYHAARLLVVAEIVGRLLAVHQYLLQAVNRVAVLVEQVCIAINLLEIRGGGASLLGAHVGLALAGEVIPVYLVLEDISLQILRRCAGVPSGPHAAVAAHQAVALDGVLAVHIDPAGSHAAVLVKAVVIAVDLAQLVLVIRHELFSVGLEIVPVFSIDVEALIAGEGAVIIIVIVVVVLVLRRIQKKPAHAHRAVVAQIDHVVVGPAGLHHAVVVEQIPLVIDLLPGVGDHLSAAAQVVPGVSGRADPGIIDGDLLPLIRHHDAVGIHVILIVHPAVESHISRTVQISPEVVRALTPRVRDLSSIRIVVYPGTPLLRPALGRPHGPGHDSQGQKRRKHQRHHTFFSHSSTPLQQAHFTRYNCIK